MFRPQYCSLWLSHRRRRISHGDDTLWHNERIFADAQAEFRGLLAAFHPGMDHARLADAGKAQPPAFGYGIKGFALSMIETAIELTEGRIHSRDIRHILDITLRMFCRGGAAGGRSADRGGRGRPTVDAHHQGRPA